MERYQQYLPVIKAAAAKHGVDPAYLMGLLQQESGFNPKAVSKSGAQGIAQFMPATAKEYGIDPLNPQQAIPGAARYLKKSLGLFGGDYNKALASYNAGPGAVQRYKGIPPFRETRDYVKKINTYRGKFSGLFGAPPAPKPKPAKPTQQPQPGLFDGPMQMFQNLMPKPAPQPNIPNYAPYPEMQRTMSLIDNTWNSPEQTLRLADMFANQQQQQRYV